MPPMTNHPIIPGAPVEITTNIHVSSPTPTIRKIFTDYLTGAVNIHSIDFGDRVAIRGTVSNVHILQKVMLPMMTVTPLGAWAEV